MIQLIDEYRDEFGTRFACESFGISESAYYRSKLKKPMNRDLKKHHRKLSLDEENSVLFHLNSSRFEDQSIPEVYATLLDEGTYICSERTMYRILNRHKAVKERRDQLRHPEYQKPELLATAPNQLWSWDITKLRTHKKWCYHYLYVIMDVYSRYVVGWMVAERESSLLAEQLIWESCRKEGIERDQLTIHADRGSAMKSKTVAQLMSDLGITKTHSRPHVSNDNPYSESQFKTLKYHGSYPKKFNSLFESKIFLNNWFEWYNYHHHHSGIQMMTPNQVHHGLDKKIREKRQSVLEQAFDRNPSRFVKGKPILPQIQAEVWINKPQSSKVSA